MLQKLSSLIDVNKCVASVEADRVRELAKVAAAEGGAGSVNSKARGAVQGALQCMLQRELLAAVLGDTRAFAHLNDGIAPDGQKKLEQALLAAAAAGFVAQVSCARLITPAHASHAFSSLVRCTSSYLLEPRHRPVTSATVAPPSTSVQAAAACRW